LLRVLDQLGRKLERRARPRLMLFDRHVGEAAVVRRVGAVLLEVDGEALHAFENGPVAGAAAEVAVEEVLDLLLLGLRVVAQEREHVHHEAGRAVAALRAVVRGDPELHGVEFLARAADSLGGGDHGAIERAERTQTGVDGRLGDALLLRLPAREHHRAGAAASLAAGKFRAGESDRVAAQPVDEQRGGVGIGDLEAVSVDIETDRVRGGHPLSSCRILPWVSNQKEAESYVRSGLVHHDHSQLHHRRSRRVHPRHHGRKARRSAADLERRHRLLGQPHARPPPAMAAGVGRQAAHGRAGARAGVVPVGRHPAMATVESGLCDVGAGDRHHDDRLQLHDPPRRARLDHRLVGSRDCKGAIMKRNVLLCFAALAVAHGLAAQPVTCPAPSTDWVRVPELVRTDTTDGSPSKLKGTIIISAEQQCIASRVPPSHQTPASKASWAPQFVRVIKGVDAVPAAPVVPPNTYPYPLSGPTLRARVGDLVELTLLNYIDPGKFPYSIDQGEKDPPGCDQTSTYPNFPGVPPQYVDTFPDCFHGSSTVNIHFHGTHVNPNSTGDNVFLELRPSPRTKDAANAPTITQATVKDDFETFFGDCEKR